MHVFAGPRGCIGETLARQEMFIMISGLLQQFTFTKASPDDVLDFEGIQGITLQPKPYQLIATARE